MRTSSNRLQAFSLPELAVLIVITGLLMLVLMPARDRRPLRGVRCVNNLKNVALAFQIFAVDNGDKLPMQVSTNKGGVSEFQFDPAANAHVFQSLSNELSTPTILICPLDRRKAAPNFTTLKNRNISYFVGWASTATDATAFLAGDRQIATTVRPITPGTVTISSNNASALYWSSSPHRTYGCIAYGDGTVQRLSDTGLRAAGTNLTHTNVITLP